MDAQGGNLSETVDFLRELLKEPEVARILSSRATSLAARREVSTCNTQAPQMPQSPCSMQGTIQSTDSTRESEHLANLEDTGGLDICLPKNHCSEPTIAPANKVFVDDTFEPTLEEYLERKDDIQEVLRTHGSTYFMPQASSGKVGLVNQGATCYLNSLLQTLFMTREFRTAVFQWEYRAERDGPKETCIPYQLQALFARLKHSSLAAVSTRQLTASFGWTASVAFQQHDVQELCQVLFEALARASVHLGRLLRLYEGKVIDYIQDVRWPKQGERRAREEPFTGVQLEVQNMGSLHATLRKYVEPELLSGENQWQCDDAGTRVDAHKGLAFKSFPAHLMLHLRRFMYDWNADRRVKLDDPLSFPLEVDLAEFLSDDADADEARGSALRYALYAILIHSGTATGGHYVAYIQDPDTKDASSAHSSARTSATSAAATSTLATSEEATRAHDNSAVGREEATGEGGWFCFNDAHVTPLSERDLRGVMGLEPRSLSPKEAGGGTSPPVAAPRRGSSGNAYMLLYRRMDAEGSPEEAEADPPAEVLEQVAEENGVFRVLQRLYRLGQRVVQLSVHRPGADPDGPPNIMHVMEDTPLCQVTAAAARAAGLHLPSSRLRLRRYCPSSGKAGETFGGKEEDNVAQLGLAPRADLLLETRGADDPPFPEFNPNEFSLQVARWQPETSSEVEGSCRTLVVPGEQAATLGALREAVASAMGVAPEKQHLAYVDNHYKICNLLAGDHSAHLLHLGLSGGEKLLLEEARELSTQAGSTTRDAGKEADEDAATGAPHVMTYHLEKQNTVELSFNSLEEPRNFDNTLLVDLRKTLSEAKTMIGEALRVDAACIHLRRSAVAPQLQNESLTLRSLGFVEQSVLFVGKGPPRKAGHFLIKISLFAPEERARPFKQLFELDVPGSLLVEKLREKLAVRLVEQGGPLVEGWEGGGARVRVRDRRGAEAGRILLAGSTLKSAIPRLSDGKELAVQLLAQPEEAGPEDMLILVRQWMVLAGLVGKPRELLVRRSITHKELRAQLAAKYKLEGDLNEPSQLQMANPAPVPSSSPFSSAAERESPSNPPSNAASAAGLPRSELERPELAPIPTPALGIAKASMFGPALNVGALAKLRWNADLAAPESPIVQMPLGLRDGGLVIVRHEAEIATSALKKPAGTVHQPNLQVGIKQTKLSISRGLRAGNRMQSQEQGIKIHVYNHQSDNASPSEGFHRADDPHLPISHDDDIDRT